MEIPLPEGTYKKHPVKASFLGNPNIVVGIAKNAENGEIVGFIRLDKGPGIGDITLFVEQEYRRTGVGRMLFSWIKERAGHRKLFAMVSEKNNEGICFFDAMKFERRATELDGWVKMELAEGSLDR